jgi:hypothetical protein
MSLRFRRPERARKPHRPVMMLVAAVAALSPALAVMGIAGPASASPVVTPDTPIVSIHLTNAKSYCVGVKNDNNHAGAGVWLYKCAQAKSHRWYELGYTCPGGFGQSQCMVFLDVKNTKVCFGLTASRTGTLLGCGQGGILPPYRAVWGPGAKNGLINTAFGTVEGSLWTAKAANKATLRGEDRQAGGGGWWRWSGF